MKQVCSLVLLTVLGLLPAGRAHAEEAAPLRDPVFEDVSFEEPRAPKKMIELELKAVQSKCVFSRFSREGPSLAEVRVCEGAVAQVARRGPAAIGAIFKALDDGNTTWEAKRRLYDLLARTKDTRLIEPLVRGLSRITARHLKNREWELSVMQDALSELSQAPIREALPGIPDTRQVSLRRRTLDVIVDYRYWLEQNAGLSYDELVAKRTAEEIEHVNDENIERSYRAILYLLKHKNAAGIEAGAKFAGREDVPENLRRVVGYQVEAAKKAAPQKAKKNQVAKSKPVQAPPAKKKPAPSDVDLASRARS